MGQPRLFIGSASETREIVDALEDELRDVARIDRWDVDVFRPGHFTLEELLRAVNEVDFGVFVLGREDATESRGVVTASPRDNVVFEAGLFTAVLGRERTFFVVDAAGTKIPSDWEGLGYTTFTADEERARDKVYDAVRQIRKQISRWQPLENLGALGAVVGQWWQYVLNTDSGAVVSVVEISAVEPFVPRLHGEAWSSDGAPVARYRSQAARWDEADGTLHYSWEGEHPRQEGIPRFFGVGEILFRLQPGATASRGEGWFSRTNRLDARDSHTKSTAYVRASREELETLHGSDHERRAALIRSKLEERTHLSV